jgi:hypothetical protein
VGRPLPLAEQIDPARGGAIDVREGGLGGERVQELLELVVEGSTVPPQHDADALGGAARDLLDFGARGPGQLAKQERTCLVLTDIDAVQKPKNSTGVRAVGVLRKARTGPRRRAPSGSNLRYAVDPYRREQPIEGLPPIPMNGWRWFAVAATSIIVLFAGIVTVGSGAAPAPPTPPLHATLETFTAAELLRLTDGDARFMAGQRILVTGVVCDGDASWLSFVTGIDCTGSDRERVTCELANPDGRQPPLGETARYRGTFVRKEHNTHLLVGRDYDSVTLTQCVREPNEDATGVRARGR